MNKSDTHAGVSSYFLNGIEHLGDLDMDEIMTLRRTSEESGEKLWAGSDYPEIQASAGSYDHPDEHIRVRITEILWTAR
jgi:hypothetical protein